MKSQWKRWLEQAAGAVREWVGQETHSFAELAELIRHHPDTVQSERTWLGLTYRFYSLALDGAALKMETKVAPAGRERILQLSLHPRGPRRRCTVVTMKQAVWMTSSPPRRLHKKPHRVDHGAVLLRLFAEQNENENQPFIPSSHSW